MKAYEVTSRFTEVIEIVFANTRNEAKKLALESEWFSGLEYLDLSAKRNCKADHLSDKKGILKPTIELMRWMRDEGWYQAEGTQETCEECGLAVWESIDGSHLNEDGICQECEHEPQTNE